MKKFNLAEWALRHKSIIYYFIAMFFTLGVFSFLNLGRMEDPNFTIRTMVVAASWPGASPEQTSSQVTDKLEEKLRNLPGLDYTKSFTDGEKAVIYINLKETVPASDIKQTWTQARQMINDEWHNLPSGVQGPMINDQFDDVFGTIYAVTGKGYTKEEQRAYAEQIKRALLTVPHVKNIQLKGVQDQRIYVRFDKDKLSAYHVSSQDIVNALKQQSAMVPAGTVSTNTTTVFVRINGLFDNLDAIRNMPLEINNQTLRLGDLADVKLDYQQPETPSFYYNGQPGIGIAVSMEPGANNIQFGKDLQAKLDSIKGQLPLGLNVDLVSDQPKVVEDSISEFTHSLFEAIIIVLAVSFFSLGVRSGVVVALTIPVVVATTFVGMYLDSIDLHKVSLGALIISLGLLVDDAIIVVEMMKVKLEQGLDRTSAATAAYKSTAMPMLSGTLITCAGFLPVGISKGMVAEFTHVLFIVVAMALLLSWLASVLVSPVLAYSLVQEEQHHAKETRQEKLQKVFYAKFEDFLHWALSHRRIVLGAVGGLFILSLIATPLIKKEFFPAATRPELVVSVQFPQSSSLAFTKAQSEQLDKLLKGDDRIEKYSAYVGEGAPRFILTIDPEVQRNNFMQYVIVAKSVDDRNALYNSLTKELAEKFPSSLVNIQYIQTGPPSKYPIMLRVSGPDPVKLRTIANDVKAQLAKTPDVTEVGEDWPESEPVARVTVDPVKARLMGIDSYHVALELQSKISGLKVGEYYESNRTVPIVFKLSGNAQSDLAKLKDIPIQTSSGAYVSLDQIATISMGEENGILWHRDMTPTITVHGNVPPWVMANSTEEDVYKALQPLRDSLPAGYTIQMDGAAEKSVTALDNLKVPLPAMIFVIMTVLMFQLKKIPLMIMAMLTAPLGLIGVILTMLVTRTPLSFMAVLGIIALSGMIIRNSIILIDQIEVHRKDGQSTYDAIVSSAVLRFRPIMLTAMAAILGMVPLMSSAFWSPLAIAFSGGLLVATVLTLVVLPVMYAVYYKA